jgi:hypothetical protein
MSALEIGRPTRRYKPVLNLVYLLLFIAVIAGIYFISPRFEWHAPQITLTPDNDTIGLAPVAVEVNERGAGLKSFSAILNAGGTEHVLASEEYDEPAAQKKMTIALSSKLSGLKEARRSCA